MLVCICLDSLVGENVVSGVVFPYGLHKRLCTGRGGQDVLPFDAGVEGWLRTPFQGVALLTGIGESLLGTAAGRDVGVHVVEVKDSGTSDSDRYVRSDKGVVVGSTVLVSFSSDTDESVAVARLKEVQEFLVFNYISL